MDVIFVDKLNFNNIVCNWNIITYRKPNTEHKMKNNSTSSWNMCNIIDQN